MNSILLAVSLCRESLAKIVIYFYLNPNICIKMQIFVRFYRFV